MTFGDDKVKLITDTCHLIFKCSVTYMSIIIN